MLLASTGFTCGTTFSNDGTLTSGTSTSVPDRFAGSTAEISFSTAMIDAYSVPCDPATMASAGPGRAPLITTTAMSVAGSDPAGTWMAPNAF